MAKNEIVLLDSFGRDVPAVDGKRSFEGARVTRLTQDWLTSQTSLDSDLRWQLKKLIDRSRWFEQNTEYGEAALKQFERNVIGPDGFQLQMKIRDANGLHDRTAEDTIEQGWKEWSKKGNCDITGSLSLNDHYKVCLRSIIRDGGHMIQKHAGSGPWGFQIEAKDIDFLDPDYNVELKNGGRIVMSVEVDSHGRPIAYHLLGNHPGDMYWTSGRDVRTRVMADRIIHPFIRKRSNQHRGYPEFACLMPNFRHLSAYKEAYMVNQRTAAARMGFITKQAGEMDGYTGAGRDTGGKFMDVEPGSLEELPAGMGFTPWDPKQPASEFTGVVKENLRGNASALGISYISYANDPGDANFSSARVGLVDERESYKMMQSLMIEHVCNDIFCDWLAIALMAGKLGTLPPMKYEKFNHPVFRGRRWEWLDPKADSDAAKQDVEMGITSNARVAADRGTDEEEVLDEIEQTLSRRAKAGLVPTEKLNAIKMAEAMSQQQEEKADEPIISSIGVGGVQGLVQILQSVASGELTQEQAETILVSVFGIPIEAAKKIATGRKKEG